MAKKILHGTEARAAIMVGVDILANTVKATLGPLGRNVVIEKQFGPPVITKDGVTVAKEIFLADSYQNMGAQLVKTVASKTADVAGDGTTTATLLAQVIYREGVELLAQGANPVPLKRGIDHAVDVAVAHLKLISTPIQREHDSLAAVGTISANGDKEIGEIIASAMDKVGIDGLVSLAESNTHETVLEVVDGMQFDRGYISPWFITDAIKNEAVLTGCAILVTERKIGQTSTLQNLLGTAAGNSIPVLVICEEVEGDALAFQCMNVQEGKLKVCSVRAPSFGLTRREMLHDIAAMTGAYCFTEDAGRKLDSVTLSDLGGADRVVVGRSSTMIIGGKGDKPLVAARVASIKEQIASCQDDYELDQLKHRLAKLAGGVAVIKVGAASETEMMELKARVEDAIHATRAAAEEGIVPGGGVALLRCIPVLQALVEKLEGEAKQGAGIVLKALEAPLLCICENAGVDGATVLGELVNPGTLSALGISFGYNAATDRFEDLVEAGVIDPTKVTRLALQNAASVASVMLTTEAMISEIIPVASALVGGQ